MSFLETLLMWDKELFLTLNAVNHPQVDLLMFYISKMWIWIPLYLGVIFFFVKKWKMEAIWIILSVVICVVLTDQLTNLTKEICGRQVRICFGSFRQCFWFCITKFPDF